jgi:hypothetical protein
MNIMAKFVTIGYGDREGYDRTEPSARAAAHNHDEKLRSHGAVMGIAGSPVQVRNPDGRRVEASRGSYMNCPLPVAGFALIEAENLEDAIRLVAGTPCAVAHGVVEVWPLDDPFS